VTDDVSQRRSAVWCAPTARPFCAWERVCRSETPAGTKEFVRAQLESALSGLEERFHPLVTVAYEPLWAIGTGVTATGEQVPT